MYPIGDKSVVIPGGTLVTSGKDDSDRAVYSHADPAVCDKVNEAYLKIKILESKRSSQ